jgi:hypothetical protein
MSEALSRIEQIVAEIEALDAASKGQFRQASDREAYDIACQIERRMQQAAGQQAAS